MDLEKLCQACRSLFTAEAIETILSGISPESTLLTEIQHLSYVELVQSTCPLCKCMVAGMKMGLFGFPREYKQGMDLNKYMDIEARRPGKLYSSGTRFCVATHSTGDGLYFLGETDFSLVDGQVRENVVARRLNPGRMPNQATISQIESWITECTSAHESCNNLPGTMSPQKSRPSRLVEVLEKGQKLRIVSTDHGFSNITYATLSHCWGDGVDCRLLKENMDLFYESISLDILPQTFTDCVEAVWRLGFQYVWIDALCIVQDSKEDWLRDSSKMGDIYAGSILNIAAAVSKNGREGLFHPPCPAPCVLEFAQKDGLDPHTFVSHYLFNFRTKVEDHSLNQRAWALQERILSPRTIHFAHGEVFWECRCLIASEIRLNEAEYYPHRDQPSFKSALMPVPSDQKIGLWRWRLIVTEYSLRKLTKGTDKLPALSGLARRISQCAMLDEADYLAGLWRKNLIKHLLWQACSNTCVVRSQFPSWSWAKIEGEIVFHLKNGKKHIQILDAQVERGSDPFGAVERGFIALQGPLCRLQISRPHEIPQDRSKWITQDGYVSLPECYIHWDHCTNVEFDWGPLYFLICDVDYMHSESSWYTGLVLQAAGEKNGHYERLGFLTIAGKPESDIMDISKDVNMLDKKAFAAHDPDLGFTVTID